MRVAELGVADLRRIGEIDRSEHVDRHYGVSDGRLVERPVTIGLRNWDVVEITRGVAPGDLVVVSLDRAEVKAGAAVTVVAEVGR